MASYNKNMMTRILLVDNEFDNTSVLGMGLEDEGYKVESFNDSIVALSNFKPNYYSLVILDINMPNMNGYELYKEIRKLDDKVKICFLTASEVYNKSLRIPEKEILDAVKCFIPKPLTIEDFVRKVEKEIEDAQ
ncbi:MAG TPA: response regulator [Nitrososphaeraceae archaeon]|jgi:CheY-like chemotaxis protein